MISVIVPAYNAEDYIEECLQSLNIQTYKDFEVIVIDDGSNDKTKDVIKKYALMDNRIRPYYNENHGVSYSRNFGLRRCNGEYITFVDSDDVVSETFLETLYNNLVKYDADMSAINVAKQHNFSENLFTNGEDFLFEGEDILRQLFGVYEGFLCNKLFKKSLLHKNNIFMEQTIGVCEDLLFNVQYLRNCNRVIYNTGVKYFYRQISNSAINRLDNKKWFDCINAYQKILPLLSEYPSVKISATSCYTLHLCEAMYRMKYISDFTEEEKNKILRDWKASIGLFSSFDIKCKIKIILYRCFPGIVMKYRRRKL